jgi:hypothetical protein
VGSLEPLEARLSEHIAVVPPFDPAQVQLQGPLPVTVDGVPALQNPLVGAVLVMTPFAGPHWPFTGGAEAPQIAVLPPFDPAQVQLQGPLPVTVDGVPALQNPLVGAVLVMTPFAGPHWPFSGGAEASGAPQIAVLPPLLPTQVQVQGPLPVTVVAVPALQRLAVGAVVTPTPAATPHKPYTRWEGERSCASAGPKTMNERRKANTAQRKWRINKYSPPQASIFAIGIVKEPLTARMVRVSSNPYG